ncbi:MAG: SnoaL-like domain-containing protein [Phycisphaerales bacterium]
MSTATSNEAVTKIAKDLVAHCKSGTNDDTPLWDKHFAPDFVSVEGDGTCYTGREEVLKKHQQWHDDVIMHGGDVTGPFVGPTGFSVIFDMDVESKSGRFPRMNMREIADYTVENGKVVREEFRFDPAMCEG